MAADAFLAELGNALEQIVAHPKLHPSYTRNTRKKSLKKFPYAVVFREKKDTILIVAVAHAKRRPGYWAKRL